MVDAVTEEFLGWCDGGGFVRSGIDTPMPTLDMKLEMPEFLVLGERAGGH